MNAMPERIENSDITVVLQGAYSREFTPLALASVREFLPGAKMVLSTWNGTELPDMPDVELVFSEDPGPNIRANLNRQLVSTLSGLRAVKTKYALKMRTDFELSGSNFFKYFGLFQKRAPKLKILEERVLCYGWRYRPHKGNKRLFHPGDFYYFGLTSDIVKIFDIPLLYDVGENEGAINARHYSNSWNFSAEQYIWHTFLQQNSDSFADFESDIRNSDLLAVSELSYANNLVFLSYPEFSIRTPKGSLRKNNFGVNLTSYKFADWLAMYKKYCDPSCVFKRERPSFGLRLKLIAVSAILLTGAFAQAFVPGRARRLKVRAFFSGIADSIFVA